MKKRFLLAKIAMTSLLFQCALCGQENSIDVVQTKDKIKILLHDLENQSYSIREKATSELIKLGSDAIPDVIAAFLDERNAIEVLERSQQILESLAVSESTREILGKHLADLDLDQHKHRAKQIDDLRNIVRWGCRDEEGALAILEKYGCQIYNDGKELYIGYAKRDDPEDYVVLLAIKRPFAMQFATENPSATLFEILEESRINKATVGSGCTDETLAALGKLKQLDQIYFVNAFNIDGSGLANVRNLKDWRVLDFHSTGITGANLKHIRSCKELEFFATPQSTMDDEGMCHLASLPKLSSLRIDNTSITASGMKELSKFANLKRIELTGNKGLDDEAFSKLAAVPNLADLYVAHETRITNKGLMPLAELKSLKTISMSRTLITQHGKEEFLKLRPDVEFTGDVFDPDSDVQVQQVLDVLSHGAFVNWPDKETKNDINEFRISLYAFNWTGTREAYESIVALQPAFINAHADVSVEGCKILARLPSATKIYVNSPGEFSDTGKQILKDHFGENLQLHVQVESE